MLWLAACKSEISYKKSFRDGAAQPPDADFLHYLHILTARCGDECKLFEENTYTLANTQFHLLTDSTNQDSVLLAASELNCWCFAGSCGSDVQVFGKRNGKWESIFERCAYMGELKDTFVDRVRPFTLYARGFEGGQLKVCISRQAGQWSFDTLSRANVPYPILKTLLQGDTLCQNNEFDCFATTTIQADTLHISDQGQQSYWIAEYPETTYTILELKGKKAVPINAFQDVQAIKILPTLSNGRHDLLVQKLMVEQTWKWKGKGYTLISQQKAKG